MLKYILLLTLILYAQTDAVEKMLMMFLKMVRKNPKVAASLLKNNAGPLIDVLRKEIGNRTIINEYVTIVEDIFSKHPEFIDGVCEVLHKNLFIIDTLERSKMNEKQAMWFINQVARADGVKDLIFKIFETYPNILYIYFNYLATVEKDKGFVEICEFLKNHPETYKEIYEIFEFLNDRNKALELINKFREKGIPYLFLELTNLLEELLG